MRGRCAKDDIISQSCTGYCVLQPSQPHTKAALCLSHCYIRTPSYTLGANLSSRWTQGMHSSLHPDTRSHSEWVSGMELEPAAVSLEIWHPQSPDLILVFEALPLLSLTNSITFIRDASTPGLTL